MDATNQLRTRIWLARILQGGLDSVDVLSKAQLDEVVAAIDAFFDANAVAINQAIPQPQRGLLSTAAKAAIVGAVAFRRAGKLSVQEDG